MTLLKFIRIYNTAAFLICVFYRAFFLSRVIIISVNERDAIAISASFLNDPESFIEMGEMDRLMFDEFSLGFFSKGRIRE